MDEASLPNLPSSDQWSWRSINWAYGQRCAQCHPLALLHLEEEDTDGGTQSEKGRTGDGVDPGDGRSDATTPSDGLPAENAP